MMHIVAWQEQGKVKLSEHGWDMLDTCHCHLIASQCKTAFQWLIYHSNTVADTFVSRIFSKAGLVSAAECAHDSGAGIISNECIILLACSCSLTHVCIPVQLHGRSHGVKLSASCILRLHLAGQILCQGRRSWKVKDNRCRQVYCQIPDALRTLS